MSWLFSLLGGLGKLAGIAASWFSSRQADKHDAEQRQHQQTEDALKGESDALKQVDRLGTALDSGGVRIADDPDNINR